MEDLIGRILVESDKGKRDQMIKEAYQLGQETDWAYVPLHRRRSPGACRRRSSSTQRADNQILLYWFRKD